jgi:hypothetical protein
MYGTNYMGRAVRLKAPSPRSALRTMSLAVLGVALGGAIYGGTVLAEWAVESDTFLLEKIKIGGAENLPEYEIMEAAGVARGVNIFRLPIDDIRGSVASLPTVKCCSVQRRLPDGLMIKVAERRPYFLVNSGGVWRVDREGVVLGRAEAEDLENLFVVALGETGPISPGVSLAKAPVDLAVRTIRAMHRYAPELCESVSEICVTPQEQIVLFTCNPPHRVIFGADGPKAESLVALETVLGDLRRRNLSGMEIDLRFSRQLVVRAGEGRITMRDDS